MPCYRSQVSNLIGWGRQEHTVVRHFFPIKCSFVAVTTFSGVDALPRGRGESCMSRVLGVLPGLNHQYLSLEKP